MKYTNEFLARVYGAYYGCQYIDRVSKKQKSLEADIISEIHAFGKYKTYQLTLTPLSKITDEDAIEVAKMAYPTEETKYSKYRYSKPDKGQAFGVEEMHEQVQCVLVECYLMHPMLPHEWHKMCLVQIDLEEFSIINGEWDKEAAKFNDAPSDNNQKILDYLRSRGYDCGYGEIPSLIEAGIAIDKTTL